MGLASALGIYPGITSVVGSGGKTTLMAALAHELPGTVVLTTTTHIMPYEGMPTLLSPTIDEVREALGRSRVICAGSSANEKNDKLIEPSLGIEALAQLADYVLVEADGSRRLPLKAHAPWEPVIPACSQRTVLVIGASGLDRPVHAVVHRAEIFCELAGCANDDLATPELVARVANTEALADVAFINQEDVARKAARKLAGLLDITAITGSAALQKGPNEHVAE